MLRLIMRETLCNPDGESVRSYETVDVHNAHIEGLFASAERNAYRNVEVVGAEYLQDYPLSAVEGGKTACHSSKK